MTRAKPPQQDHAAASENQAPTGLARSPKRVSSWAANLLATAIVLAAGLTFGRQALIWWYADPAPPDVATAAGPLLGDETSPHLLEFGDFPFALQREVLHGDRRAAIDQLLVRCRDVARSGEQPKADLGPAEASLLRRIEDRTPIAAEDGWKLFAIEEPLPLATATVERPSPEDSGPRRRVVCWGLALPELGVGPTEEDRWTLFTWSAAGAVRAVAIEAPPLPRGAQRLMRLAAEDGSALVAFRGGGAPRDVMDFYNECFSSAAQGDAPSAVSLWREVGGVWHARFEQPQRSVDVQLMIDDRGGLSGVLSVTMSGEQAARNNTRE